tara:strand:+ start:6634 stop:8145 length:1512 start_codon:yes stop_codon:yes gene_type:complete
LKEDLSVFEREVKLAQQNPSGRRTLSWLIFTVIFLFTLLIPLIVALSTGSHSETSQTHDIEFVADMSSINQNSTDYHKKNLAAGSSSSNFFLKLDSFWNPGTLASAHQSWSTDCKACHATPFIRTQDTTCNNCHEGIGYHIPSRLSANFRDEPRCGSCHLDHNGDFGLKEQNLRYTESNCSGCHEEFSSFSVIDTKVKDVSDFEHKHPNFRLQIAESAGSEKLMRVRMKNDNSMLSEPTGLKFPHDVHLNPEGVRSPKGLVDTNCESCHELTLDERTYRAISFENHCQSCHKLKFEPLFSNREVPHGTPEEVLSTLSEFYAYFEKYGLREPSPMEKPLRWARAGQKEPEPIKSFLKLPKNSQGRATAASIELFEKTSCIVCHQVERKSQISLRETPGSSLPQWNIAAVTPPHVWVAKAAPFNHKAHTLAECSSCHDAENSKKAENVLMPGISTCRDCHAGSAPVKNRVSSDCGLCHGYHMLTEEIDKNLIISKNADGFQLTDK